MVRLKNIWNAALAVFHPTGHPESLSVDPGQVAEVPGTLAAEQPLDDAIVIDVDGEPRLYPSAQWEHVPGVDMDATPTEVPQPVTDTPAGETEPAAAPEVVPVDQPVAIPQPVEPSITASEG